MQKALSALMKVEAQISLCWETYHQAIMKNEKFSEVKKIYLEIRDLEKRANELRKRVNERLKRIK